MNKKSNWSQYLPGLMIAVFSAGLSMVLGKAVPILGSSLFAILCGILLNASQVLPQTSRSGLSYSGKKLLQYSIILMGFTLSFQKVTKLGLSSLVISLPTISIAFLSAFAVGYLLKAPKILTTLVGMGTAICGGSAIAAASPVLEADENDIALSMSTIFFFNILAVFLFPFFGHLLAMTNQQFGFWAGTAINDTSSVVAAAFSYSKEAGEIATVVKLTRALMIIPICFGMLGLKLLGRMKQDREGKQVKLSKIVPWFIFYFLLASLVASFGWFPSSWIPFCKWLSHYLMAMALVGIGSQVSIQAFRKQGVAPLLIGLVAWVAVSISSLLLQYFLGI